MATFKALLIPWQGSEPVQLIDFEDTDDGYQSLRQHLFGEDPELLSHATVGHFSVSDVRGNKYLSFQDDEGMWTQVGRTNQRAMKLISHLAGGLEVIELLGNYVFIGVTRWGDTIDIHGPARDYFAEEGIGTQ